jgi:hypothetical protein
VRVHRPQQKPELSVICKSGPGGRIARVNGWIIYLVDGSLIFRTPLDARKVHVRYHNVCHILYNIFILFSNPKIKMQQQQRNNATIQQYNNTTKQRNNTTIQQYNNTTIQQHSRKKQLNT